jgi:hypothetical protein
MTCRIVVMLLIALCDASCRHKATRPSDATLVAIARSYASQHDPSWLNEFHNSVNIREGDRTWIVTFRVESGPETFVQGGGPVFEIDKWSLQVTRAYHTQ